MNEKHGKTEKPTARSKEGVTASGKGSEGWFDGGGDWRERKSAGEGES